MNFSGFQFDDTQWLWMIALIPVVALLYYLFYKAGLALERLKPFADAHLLPHLVKNRRDMHRPALVPLIIWSLIWACGALAMAGPRWDYKDVEAVKPERALVILLDLSASMDAQDVKPSRVARAREKIEDILDMSRGVNIGLIAFAAVPHMVAPLTDDMATIRNFVPALDTHLVYMQGSRLAPAMEMAVHMLDTAPGRDK
jgi:Ca-activated chloride channel homolog